MKSDADSIQPNAHDTGRLVRTISVLAASLAIVTGGMVLVGWRLDIPALKFLLAWDGNWVAMNPKAALAFILLGITLLFSSHRLTWLSRPARICGWLAGLIGLLTLISYGCGGLPGFDPWLIPKSVDIHPGRMAPDAALCVLLLAIGFEIVCMSRQRKRMLIAFVVLNMLTLALELVEILSYLMPSLRIYGWGGLPMMACPTAILLAILGMTMLLVAARKIQRRSTLSTPGMAAPIRRIVKFLAIFFLMALGLFVACAFYYRNYEQHYRAQVAQELSDIADLKTEELLQWRKERLGDGTIFFKNAAFSKLVRRFLDNAGDTAAQADLYEWLYAVYMAERQYDQIRLLSTNGIPLMAASTNSLPVSSSVVSRIPGILDSNQAIFFDFHRHSFDGNIYLTMIIPIFDEKDCSRPLGVMAMRINPKTYIYPMLQRWPTPSSSGETLLVRREGNEAVFLNDLRFQTNAALNLRIPLSREQSPAAYAALGENNIMEGVDYRGVPVLAATRTIPASPWALVARMDIAEAFRPLRQELWEMLVMLGVLIFSAGVGVWLLWRRQHIQFYQNELKAMAALRQSEEQLALVLEGSQTGTWDWDIKTDRVQRNEFYYKMLGYSFKEYDDSPKHWPALVHPDDLAVARKAMQDHLEGRLPAYQVEYRMRHKNGQYRWILDQGRIVRHDSQGNPLRMAGTHIDITERKQAEEARIASQQIIEGLINMMPLGVFWKDKNSVYLGCNKLFAYVAGFSDPKDVVGKDDYQMSWRKDAEKYRAVDRQVIESNSPRLAAEEPLQFGEEGDIRTLLQSKVPIHNAQGDVVGVLGTFLDITTQKQATSEIRKLAEMLDTAPSAIAVHDFDGRYLYANQTACTMHGYSMAEFLSLNLRQLDVPESAALFPARIQTLRECGETSFEVAHFRKDGTILPLAVSAKTIIWDGKQAILGMSTDITARKRVEAALQDSQERLNFALRAAKMGTWQWDIVQNRRYYSDQTCHLLGLDPKKFGGTVDEFLAALHPDDRDYIKQNLQQTVEKGVPYDVEYRVVWPDGSIHYVSARGSLDRDEQGRPLRISGLDWDDTAHKQVEIALRESENKYHSLYTAMSDGMALHELVYDAAGHPVDYVLLDVNPAFEFHTGLRREAVIGRRASEIFGGSTPYLELYADVAVTGRARHFETTYAPMKKIFSISVFTPKQAHFVTVFEDITARNQAVEKMKENEQFLREVQDIASLGSYVLDIPQGQWKSSEILDKVFGIDPIYDRSVDGWARLVHPDDQAMMTAYFRDDVLGLGQPFMKEYRIIRHNDHAERWVYGRGRLEFDSQGRPTRMIGTIHDITERKLATIRDHLAHDVLSRLNKAGAISDSITEIVALIKQSTGFDAVGLRLRDGDDFPYYAQAGFSDDFLKTENTLVVRDQNGGVCKYTDGSSFLECTCGLVLSGRTDPANPLFTMGGSAWTSNSLQLLDVPPDQDPRLHPRNRCVHGGYLSVALIPLRTGDEIIGLLQLNARDANRLTLEMVQFFESLATSIAIALKREWTEAEKEKLQGQLIQSQKMESVGRLAGGVAHDFNNMLMVILGNADLCKMKLDPGHPMHKWLDAINKGATHAKELTSQLLAFARLQPIKPKVLDFNATISDMLKWLQRLIGEHIAVNWQPGVDLWLVEMDSTQINQILTNLIINARDAIKGSGSITISTANAILDPSYCLRHSGAVPGNYVVLSVSDTGCGMDQETLAHVFEPFFTTKVMGKGTGLGLATVYGIIKQNKGHVDIYSEPGHGTRFNIYLPRALDPNARPETSNDSAPTVVDGSETILLVEDQHNVRAVTHELLVTLGYTVLVAESSEKALRLAVEHSGEIHLLVTDVIIPNMNGWELSQRLSELRPSMKHLFMSGFAATVLTQQNILEKGAHFLPKPFSRDDLARKVREALTTGGKPD